jgi:hypothetical protein
LTAEEFAASHGLSLEEAELILARRIQKENPGALGRLAVAMKALVAAQKKVGVHPVVATGDGVAKSFDEEAERNLSDFYASKGGQERPHRKVRQSSVAVEDMSQDPEDYG